MSTAAPAQHSLTARTTWLLAAKTFAFSFTIAIPLLLVRRMPQHEFGLYKQVFLVIGTAVGVLPLGFGLSAFYFLPRETDRRNQAVFNVVWFTTAVATLFATVLALFPSVLILLFNEPAAVRFAPWIGLIIVLWVAGAFLEIVTVANHDIKIATIAIVAIQITRAVFFLAAAVIGGTVGALMVAAICQGGLQVAVLCRYLQTRFPGFWRDCDLSFFRRQLAYALPFGLAGTLWTLQADLHSYVVSHRFGPTIYAVYAIGCFQVPLLAILADSVGSVMIPRVSLLQHEQRTREIIVLTANVMRKLAAVYFPAFALLFVMRREFIVGLFTDRYVDSIPIFAINLTLIPLGIFLVDPVMRAYAEHRHFLLKLHSVLIVSLAVALSVSVGRFGLVGAITLMVAFQYLGRAATLLKVFRMLRVQPRDIVLLGDVGKIAAAATAAGLTTTLARSFASGLPPLVSLAVCGVFFVAVYAAGLLALGVATAEERAVVLSGFWRVNRSLAGV